MSRKTKDKLTLAVNEAVREYRLRREALAGGGSLDSKRSCSAWHEYGYTEKLGFNHFYRLYRRGGVAHGAIKKLVGKCWSNAPYIIEGTERDEDKPETKWEREVNRLPLWRELKEADLRRLVGRYSALLLQIGDDEDWDKPVKRGQLAGMIPLWASSIKPSITGKLGTVEQWAYTDADGNETKVHPDRVFILGDATPDAIGFLEPAFNNFVNIEKVEGGSGESFLKNAARHLSIEYDKEIDLGNIAAMYGVTLEELHGRFNDAVDAINRGSDTALINQGASVQTLSSPVSDPTPTYNINLQSISSALDIPARVLAMMQTGERASTEDREMFNLRCEARRESDLSHDIKRLINHLTRIKVLRPVVEYSVVWESLTEPRVSDKLDNAYRLAEIENLVPGSFDADDVRVIAGYDPHPESVGEDDKFPLPPELDDGA